MISTFPALSQLPIKAELFIPHTTKLVDLPPNTWFLTEQEEAIMWEDRKNEI